jgi:putative tryptophan/tyrosine transport system substrate-binding protein
MFGSRNSTRREFLLLLSGAIAAARPLRAQRKAMPVIGFLNGRSPGEAAEVVAAFRKGLNATGYVEGQSVAIEYRWAEGRYDRLPAMAADLVGRKVEAIITGGLPPTRAAKNATSAIPILFLGTDPVADGLVASLARPGGNVTGFSVLSVELMPKRLQLLSELVPQARVIALLVNPNNPTAERIMGDVKGAAPGMRMQLHILAAGTENEVETAFTSLAELRVGALVVGGDPFFNSQREQFAALASRHAVPTIYEYREFPAAGGLISYGPSLTDTWREVGIYAGRILNGAKPADLPVQQPTRFELVVNRKTAEALGLTIPPSILARADEVIE